KFNAIEQNGAGIRLQRAGDQVEERALAGAVRADHGRERAVGEFERDVVRRLDAAERFGKPADLQHGYGLAASRRCAYHSKTKSIRPLRRPIAKNRITIPSTIPWYSVSRVTVSLRINSSTVPTIGPRKVVTPPSMLM